MESLNLNNEQLDALREIGNIGAGNAATALSQLLGKKVLVNVPKISFLKLDKMSDFESMIDSGGVSIAVSLKILGALKGDILVLFSQRSALLMIDMLRRREIGSTQVLTLMDTSAISESSHILSSSYINAVGEVLTMHRLIASISQIMVDRTERLDSLLIKGLTVSAETYILPIENRLIIEGIEIDIVVNFLLELESAKKILNIVGL